MRTSLLVGQFFRTNLFRPFRFAVRTFFCDWPTFDNLVRNSSITFTVIFHPKRFFSDTFWSNFRTVFRVSAADKVDVVVALPRRVDVQVFELAFVPQVFDVEMDPIMHSRPRRPRLENVVEERRTPRRRG